MRLLIVLGFLVMAQGLQAQVTISGRVRDNKGKPVPGASIAIKDSYDGATTDSTGHFLFRTSEKGERVLLTTCVGYKLSDQKITVASPSIQIEIVLREEASELKAVVVTAGTFEASDTK